MGERTRSKAEKRIEEKENGGNKQEDRKRNKLNGEEEKKEKFGEWRRKERL